VAREPGRFNKAPARNAGRLRSSLFAKITAVDPFGKLRAGSQQLQLTVLSKEKASPRPKYQKAEPRAAGVLFGGEGLLCQFRAEFLLLFGDELFVAIGIDEGVRRAVFQMRIFFF
jgi:hypothetical protein